MSIKRFVFNKKYFSSGTYVDFEKDSKLWVPKTAARILKYLHNNLSPRILEVGCAHGFLLEYLLNNSNAQVIGLEYSKYAIDHAPNKIKKFIRNGNILRRNQFAKGKFNCVICFDVVNYLTLDETLSAIKNLAFWSNQYIFFGALYKNSPQSSQRINPDKFRITTLTQKDYISKFEKFRFRFIEKFNVAATGDILVFEKK